MELSSYKSEIEDAVKLFWITRKEQKKSGKQEDRSNRKAVIGGKQLDGFIQLMYKVAIDNGIPEACIYTKSTNLPGFFRPTKNWDFVVISPQNTLIAALEFKSQVGSFGNNFNNRTEEALGSAVDIWTAYRENAFSTQIAPWLGYLMVLEKAEKSTKSIGISSPNFDVFEEFIGSSYLDRYDLLCKRLMTERHYNAASVIWTKEDYSFGDTSSITSIHTFLNSFIGHILGQSMAFNND